MLAEVIVVPTQLWHTFRQWGTSVVHESTMEELSAARSYRNYHLMGRYFGRGSLIFASDALDKDRILFIDAEKTVISSTLFTQFEPDSNKSAERREFEQARLDQSRRQPRPWL